MKKTMLLGLTVLAVLGTTGTGHAQTQAGPGINRFTEDQARGRIEEAGYGAVTGLRVDDLGIWRGRATRGETQIDVALDDQGSVVAGPGATPGFGIGATAPASPAAGGGAPPR